MVFVSLTDQYQYLGNYPPAPPLTQQQSVDNKLAQILILILVFFPSLSTSFPLSFLFLSFFLSLFPSFLLFSLLSSFLPLKFLSFSFFFSFLRFFLNSLSLSFFPFFPSFLLSFLLYSFPFFSLFLLSYFFKSTTKLYRVPCAYQYFAHSEQLFHSIPLLHAIKKASFCRDRWVTIKTCKSKPGYILLQFRLYTPQP